MAEHTVVHVGDVVVALDEAVLVVEPGLEALDDGAVARPVELGVVLRVAPTRRRPVAAAQNYGF